VSSAGFLGRPAARVADAHEYDCEDPQVTDAAACLARSRACLSTYTIKTPAWPRDRKHMQSHSSFISRRALIAQVQHIKTGILAPPPRPVPQRLNINAAQITESAVHRSWQLQSRAGSAQPEASPVNHPFADRDRYCASRPRGVRGERHRGGGMRRFRARQ